LVMFATLVGILNAKHKGSAMVPSEKPIKKSGACSSHVQKTGGRRSKTNPNRSAHRRKDPLPLIGATEFFFLLRLTVDGS
jgi:hypothetical protein